MVLGKLTLSRICDDKLRKDPLLRNSDLIQDLFRVAALGRQRQQQQGGDLGIRFCADLSKRNQDLTLKLIRITIDVFRWFCLYFLF